MSAFLTSHTHTLGLGVQSIVFFLFFFSHSDSFGRWSLLEIPEACRSRSNDTFLTRSFWEDRVLHQQESPGTRQMHCPGTSSALSSLYHPNSHPQQSVIKQMQTQLLWSDGLGWDAPGL